MQTRQAENDADQSLWWGNIVATPTSPSERERHRKRQREREGGRRLALVLCSSRPPCLLQPVCSPSLYPSLLLPLLSSTSSSHPWDCVMRTQFQINRLQRVMKGRGGYERWGGGEWGTRVSMTTAQDSCLWNEMSVCAHICVVLCVGSRPAQWGDTIRFFFFFPFHLSKKEWACLLRNYILSHPTHTYTNAHCCETYCLITISYSLSQP